MLICSYSSTILIFITEKGKLKMVLSQEIHILDLDSLKNFDVKDK